MRDAPGDLSQLEELAAPLGDALRGRRKQLGINMTAAAEAAHISRVTWHRLEKGRPNVAWGALLAAASVVGLRLELTAAPSVDRTEAPHPFNLDEVLPLHIPLKEFPGLRQLAWQVGNGVETLNPREAFGLYIRNSRHLQDIKLSERESALIEALHTVYGEPSQRV